MNWSPDEVILILILKRNWNEEGKSSGVFFSFLSDTASSELVIPKGYILANKLFKYVYILYCYLLHYYRCPPFPATFAHL